jgi:hypothetical protein
MILVNMIFHRKIYQQLVHIPINDDDDSNNSNNNSDNNNNNNNNNNKTFVRE